MLPLLWSCSSGGAAEPPPAPAEGSPLPAAQVAVTPNLSNAYDWLIHGGRLVDGTGAPARRADLLIRDGVISHIGVVDPDTLEVTERFDATGLVVSPGFIDLHAHGDPLETPGFENFLAMGVTTILMGLDGTSPPAAEIADHLAAVARALPALNVAYLVGHNTIRLESGVAYGSPDAAGLARMAGLVDRAMDAGAFGLSLGLEYDPGARANMEELVAIARPVAARGGVVMSHMRTEDSGEVAAALDELLEVGRRSGASVHVSHLKVVLGNDPAEAEAMLSAIRTARDEGRRATGDLYPYTASFTGLAILFPEWARPPNDYERVVAARRGELAIHLRERVTARNGPDATLFGTGRWAGTTLAEVARQLDRPFEEVLIDLGPGGARAAYFVMDEKVMGTFLRDPFVAVASDGGPTMQHPRGYGTFPRVIRRHVEEDSLLELEEAVRKMSGLPASILGLDGPAHPPLPRGTLQEGWAADVLVFDPAALVDRADYETPHRLAEGVEHVWVNGQPARVRGRPAGLAGDGRVLMSNRTR
jgi:N-acyl-D-amino-acid deacylase